MKRILNNEQGILNIKRLMTQGYMIDHFNIQYSLFIIQYSIFFSAIIIISTSKSGDISGAPTTVCGGSCSPITSR